MPAIIYLMVKSKIKCVIFLGGEWVSIIHTYKYNLSCAARSLSLVDVNGQWSSTQLFLFRQNPF